MPDAPFEQPRLVQVYDPLDPDRSDLDVYVALVEELAARSVLDVGCGTGTFACLLAARGMQVTAVDPARAALDVARSGTGADRVRWLQEMRQRCLRSRSTLRRWHCPTAAPVPVFALRTVRR